jgi:GT2 family glycosyltransferase
LGADLACTTAAAPGPKTPLVSVLVVTFNPDEGSLKRCLASVACQTHDNLELILVDNGSSGLPGARLLETVQAAAGDSLPTKFHRQGTNTGFAHAMNIAVGAASGSLCLLLNPDTELEPGAVAALVARASQHPEAVGFAPKVKLLAYPDIIDSVGIEFSLGGDAAQRGLGQVDLGQFDAPEPVMGLTLGAALIRRTAFADDEVGRLDERFFMFFEDVDWSMRAGLYGKQFLAVPEAVVLHAGSESVRQRPFNWRYRLIERNVYYTAIKNFETRHLVRFLFQRTSAHLRKMVKGERPFTTARVLAEATLALASMRPERRIVQSRRRRRDSDLANAQPTRPALDLELWRPLYRWEAVRDSLGRLYAVGGDERWSRAYRYLDLMLEFDLKLNPTEVLGRLEEIAGPMPAALQAYARQIGSP